MDTSNSAKVNGALLCHGISKAKASIMSALVETMVCGYFL